MSQYHNVHKHIAPLEMNYNPQLVRDKPLGMTAFVKLVYLLDLNVSCSTNDDIFCKFIANSLHLRFESLKMIPISRMSQT